jgi:hypothetical protein
LPVRALPSTDRAAIDPEALRDDVNREIAAQQFDGAKPSPLELSWAPLWAHVGPPTREYS